MVKKSVDEVILSPFQRHHKLFEGVAAIKEFFLKQGFLEVYPPPMVENPGMETHIFPFKVKSLRKNKEKNKDKKKKKEIGFLQTSPEFEMKGLLGEGFEQIFALNYSFRDEEALSDYHRFQFLLLEWYRANCCYDSLKEDCVNLLRFLVEKLECSPNFQINKAFNSLFGPTSASTSSSSIFKFHNLNLNIPVRSISSLFQEYLGFCILDFLEIQELKRKIELDFPKYYDPTVHLLWEDWFFLLFLNEIEPYLKSYPVLFLDLWPTPLAALSEASKEDPRQAYRFELLLHGVEVANCFQELTDYKEQRRRFSKQRAEKKNLYGYTLPIPKKFYQTLKVGLPKSSGIALGVERLLSCLHEGNPNLFY